jgi:predicted esterase
MGCSASAEPEQPGRQNYAAAGSANAGNLDDGGEDAGAGSAANFGSAASTGGNASSASTGATGGNVSSSFGGHASGGYSTSSGGALAGGAAQTSGSGRGGAFLATGGSLQSGEVPPPSPASSSDPVIPPVSGDCPAFENGTISFMGMSGIRMVAGTKPPDATAPMLFYWHGTGGVSGEFERMAVAVADGIKRQNGVIVSFQNTTAGDLYSGTLIFGESDLEIVDQLVACAVRDANVDPRRIYTTGCSAGGLFATAMAALRSSYVAAAAPNSGGYVIQPPFQTDHTPPLMTIHGTPGADVVIVDFSQTSASADKYFKGRGGFVINCNTGGGHCGGGPLAADIWAFFEAHPFGVSPEPWSSGLPAGFSNQCSIH